MARSFGLLGSIEGQRRVQELEEQAVVPQSPAALAEFKEIADKCTWSGLDYLFASWASGGTERAAFLLLAHLQFAGSTALWGLIAANDHAFDADFDRAFDRELELRTEILALVSAAFRLQPEDPFPGSESLRERLEREAGNFAVNFSRRTIENGPRDAWMRPFLNIHKESTGA